MPALPIAVGNGYAALLSLRQAGDMRQPAAVTRLLAGVGVEPARLRRVRQIHSRRVAACGECRRLTPPDGTGTAAMWAGSGADGLLADGDDARRGTVLMVTVADCLPVFLTSPGGSYALLHSGWRGTGIVAEAVRQLRERVRQPAADLTAVIGPGIGACCYNVDDDRYRLFVSRYGPDSVRSHGGRRFLDLRAANVVLLRRAGVRDIHVIDECTSCSTRLHSSRRDGGGLRCRLMAALLAPA